MTDLFSYDLLINEVFYKCWHILEWIEAHHDMSDLDKEAIQATIMDALVYKKLIDPTKQSLDLKNMCIVDNLDHYNYEKYPNISGIPLWMKEKFRQKCIVQTGGIPISMFLSRPPTKVGRYCVYDPNTAVSAIFNDATFYDVIYTSPTRGVRLEEPRPFVEVEIDDELYLVDVLTKRILKSSWFKENYGFEIKREQKISKMNFQTKHYYKKQTKENNMLGETLFLLSQAPLQTLEVKDFAEYQFELEQSKKNFKEEWKKYELVKKDFEQYTKTGVSFLKKSDN